MIKFSEENIITKCICGIIDLIEILFLVLMLWYFIPINQSLFTNCVCVISGILLILSIFDLIFIIRTNFAATTIIAVNVTEIFSNTLKVISTEIQGKAKGYYLRYDKTENKVYPMIYLDNNKLYPAPELQIINEPPEINNEVVHND